MKLVNETFTEILRKNIQHETPLIMVGGELLEVKIVELGSDYVRVIFLHEDDTFFIDKDEFRGREWVFPFASLVILQPK